MRFCPKCNFNLNITKALQKKYVDSASIIDNIDNFIYLVLNNDPKLKNDNIKILFSKINLKENQKFDKLNNKNKEQIISQFDKLNIGISQGYYICNNCGYYTNIKPGTIIYSSNLHKTEINQNINSNYILCKDKTLPRTKDYQCINKSCISYDKKNIMTKEAIFYRPNPKSYQLKYICCTCEKDWLIG